MDRQPNDNPFSFAPISFTHDAAPNPFLPQPVTRAAPVDAVWSHDATDGQEDEMPGAEALDVRVLWGSNVLHFAQLSPLRDFTLGDAESDFAFAELGGSAPANGSYRLVVVREERPYVLIAEGAVVRVTWMNGATLSLAQCIENGSAQRTGESPGAYELLLPQGATATVRFPSSDLLFEVSHVRAGHKPDVAFWSGADLSGQIYTGLSALVHATLIGALAFFMPSMHADDAEAIDRDAAAAMRPYLTAIAEKEPERAEAVAELESAAPSGGGRGSQAAGPSGTMGSSVSRSTQPARFGVRGETPDTKLSHERAMVEAEKFGFVGILNTDAASSANTPIAAWGAAIAVGHDPNNALGNMWAPTIDDAFGAGGLGPSGTGEGGGGLAQGVGLNGIGTTVGGGSGNWPGDGPGSGPGHEYGPGGRGHAPRGMSGQDPHTPIMREETFTANGTLPREVVQRVVRQNFGRFRLCYESGLRANPGLTGRVAVAFVIDRTGAVAVAAADRSTDMADPNVVSCVVRGFQNLSFPAPKDGMVQVVYPLMLAPGE